LIWDYKDCFIRDYSYNFDYKKFLFISFTSLEFLLEL